MRSLSVCSEKRGEYRYPILDQNWVDLHRLQTRFGIGWKNDRDGEVVKVIGQSFGRVLITSQKYQIHDPAHPSPPLGHGNRSKRNGKISRASPYITCERERIFPGRRFSPPEKLEKRRPEIRCDCSLLLTHWNQQSLSIESRFSLVWWTHYITAIALVLEVL